MNYLWSEGGPAVVFDHALAVRRLAPVASLTNMARRAGQLLLKNIPGLACLVLCHLGAMLVLLLLMALVMNVSQWAGLVFGLVVILFLVGPVMRIISCHLALNMWDKTEASPLESAAFSVNLYFKALGSYLWAVYYEADLMARALPSIWPGLFTAAVMHACLHFLSRVTDIFFWDVVVFAAITVPWAAHQHWGRIRRVNFLYVFTAFEIVDDKTLFAEDLSEDKPGYWRGRFARLFYRLDDEWWCRPLNMAAFIRLLINCLWAIPSFMVIMSSWTMMGKLFVVAVFGLTFRYALRLWYDVLSAGWYRENLSSGKYY